MRPINQLSQSARVRTSRGLLRGLIGVVSSVAVVVAIGAGFVESPASAANAAPTISEYLASPASLPDTGGSLTLSATVSGAQNCTASSTPAISGLPETIDCSTGSASVPVLIPADTTAKADSYKLTLAATGSKTVKATTTVTVAAQPAPVVASFTATPATLPQAGGAIDVSAATTGATSCVFSATPVITGLPQTLPCASGSTSLSVTVPANPTFKNETYKLTLSAIGDKTVKATPVTVVVSPLTPLIDQFGASITMVPATGGTVTLSGMVQNVTSCTFSLSSAPAGGLVKGLPKTVPCSSGQASMPVTLPAVAGPYTFVLSAKEKTSVSTSVTVSVAGGVITQTSSTGGSTTPSAATSFAYQLTTSGQQGAVTFGTTTGVTGITVTSLGAMSVTAHLAPGTYTVSGSDSDVRYNAGTWTFTLTVNPDAPALNGAEYGPSGITLTFSAPALAPGQTITDFDAQFSCDGGATWQAGGDLGTTTSPAIVSGPVCPGLQYEIAAMINDSWFTLYSSPVTVDGLTPPTLSDADYNTDGIKLNFSAPPLAPDQILTDYDVQLSCDGGATWQPDQRLGTTTSPAIVFGYACAGLQYEIEAQINGSWWTPFSAPVTVDPLTSPTLSDAEYNTDGIKLTFSAPPLSSDQTVTDYDAQLSCDGGATWQPDGSLGTSTSPVIVFGHACAGLQYELEAQINGSWWTPFSSPVAVDPLTGPTLNDAEYNTDGIKLTFSPPPLSSDQTVTDLDVQLSCDGGATWQSDGLLDPTASPTIVFGPTCPGLQYEIEAQINGSWWTPFSSPVAVDPLTGPTLNDAEYDATDGVGVLSISPPPLAPDQTVTDYLYSLTCDGEQIGGFSDANSAAGTLDVPFCGSGETTAYTVIAEVNDTWMTPVSNPQSFSVPLPLPGD